MASYLSPHSTSGAVQIVAGRLKGHGDVPSSVLLVGKRMIASGSQLGILFGTCHVFLKEPEAIEH